MEGAFFWPWSKQRLKNFSSSSSSVSMKLIFGVFLVSTLGFKWMLSIVICATNKCLNYIPWEQLIKNVSRTRILSSIHFNAAFTIVKCKFNQFLFVMIPHIVIVDNPLIICCIVTGEQLVPSLPARSSISSVSSSSDDTIKRFCFRRWVAKKSTSLSSLKESASASDSSKTRLWSSSMRSQLRNIF